MVFRKPTKFTIPDDILNGLRRKGHTIKGKDGLLSVTQAIYHDVANRKVYAKSDPRKGKGSAGY